MSGPPLIAIVGKNSADGAIHSLKAEGVYDRDRRIRSFDADTLAIPIECSPSETDVRDVQEDESPDYRIRDLDDRLRARGFSAEERKRAPRSWAVLGTVVRARFENCPREAEVGEALLDLHRDADTVLGHEGIAGEHREPDVRVIAGAGDTETIHHEHGTAYAMDLAQVMFSPGNKAERVRMGERVGSDERVFDMFAGLGYFTLPMARAGANVVAVERNPTAFRFLLENAELNAVSDRVDAYRADCRDVSVNADRIVMGYFDAREYLEAAVRALRPGGRIHLHDIGPNAAPFDRAIDALEATGETFEIVGRRVVKTHSPGMDHVVVDAHHRNG